MSPNLTNACSFCVQVNHGRKHREAQRSLMEPLEPIVKQILLVETAGPAKSNTKQTRSVRPAETVQKPLQSKYLSLIHISEPTRPY